MQQEDQVFVDRYKDAKDWNSKKSGGNLKKSPFYDEIDVILGCRDLLTLPHVAQGVSTSGEETEQKEKAPVNKQDARSARKKREKAKIR